MGSSPTLPEAVRAALAAHADPVRAGPMQAYMKSTLPFHGVGTPERRRLVALCLQGRMCEGATALEAAVLALWRGATHREERYAALDLLRVPAHRRLVGLSLLPAVEEMIRSGPWWDFNDEISGQVLPLLLQRHPEVMKPLLRRWAQGDDLWFRRAAMLCQRRLKSGCDAALLYDCIRPSLGPGPLAGEFFIRKGMGWALRERAYAAPDEVRAFCAEHRDQLAPLSRREALKALARGAAAGV